MTQLDLFSVKDYIVYGEWMEIELDDEEVLIFKPHEQDSKQTQEILLRPFKFVILRCSG